MSNDSKEKVRGKVKWFSIGNGYGYITNRENVDLYFGVKDIIGSDLPEYGDIVEYEQYIGRENAPAAQNIIITEKKNPTFKKIHCNNCKVDVIPRPWHFGGTDYTNMKTAYLCPHCGGSIYESGGGFNKFAKFILIVIAVSITAIAFLTFN